MIDLLISKFMFGSNSISYCGWLVLTEIIQTKL